MNNKTSIYRSTFRKLGAIIIIFALVSCIGIFYLSKGLIAERIMSPVKESVKLTVINMSEPVHSMILSGANDQLQKLVKKTSSTSLVSMLRICSADGKVIASSIKGEIGGECSYYTPAELLDYSDSYTEMNTDGGAYEVSASTYNAFTHKSSVSGKIILGISESYIDSIFKSSLISTICTFALLFILLTAIIALVLHSTILARLKQFKGAVNQITTGNYDVSINYDKNDELQEFAEALNTMSVEIKTKQSELEMSNKHFSEYLRAMDESAIIIRSSLHGKITHANKKYYEITGADKSDTIGHSILELRGELFECDDILEYWETILNNFLWKGVIVKKNKEGEKFIR